MVFSHLLNNVAPMFGGALDEYLKPLLAVLPVTKVHGPQG